MSYPTGASGLARVCWPMGDPPARMVLHLRSGRSVSGRVVHIDGYSGKPTLVELDGGRLVPWSSIDWFEVDATPDPFEPVQGKRVDALPVVARELAGALVNAMAYLPSGPTKRRAFSAYQAFEGLHQADWPRFHPEAVDE